MAVTNKDDITRTDLCSNHLGDKHDGTMKFSEQLPRASNERDVSDLQILQPEESTVTEEANSGDDSEEALDLPYEQIPHHSSEFETTTGEYSSGFEHYSYLRESQVWCCVEDIVMSLDYEPDADARGKLSPTFELKPIIHLFISKRALN